MDKTMEKHEFTDLLFESKDQKEASSWKLFLLGIVLIVFSEIIVTVATQSFYPETVWMDALIDGLVMIFVVFPLLYYFAYRILPQQIEKRKRTETILRKVLEQLPIGVWVTDREGNILHGNQAVKDIWGGIRNVGIQEYGQFKAWWPENGQPVQNEEWGASLAIARQEAVVNQEIEIESFDGKRKIMLNSAAPFFSDKGELEGVVMVNQDITRRRQDERELRQNYELLERFFSSIGSSIAYMDRNFNFIRVNVSYARSAQHPPEFFVGKNHFDLYPNEENQVIFQRVVDTGEPFEVLEKPFEYAEFPELGVTYWNWSLQPVKGSDGSVEGLVLSLLDVTERKRAELRLAKQNEELKALSNNEHHMRELAEGLVNASIAVNSSLDLDDVLGQIIHSLQRTIPFAMSNIFLVDGNQLSLVHHWRENESDSDKNKILKHYPLDRNPQLLDVLTTRRPLHLPCGSAESQWKPVAGLEWVKSYLAAPLIVSNEAIGVIDLSCNHENCFTDQTVTQVMAFAAPAAVAINNAYLYNAEQNARKVAEILNEASADFAQTLELDVILNKFLDYGHKLVAYDNACVFLLDDEMRLTVHAVRPELPGSAGDINLNTTFELWDEPFLQNAVVNKTSVIISDTSKEHNWDPLRIWTSSRSCMAIPMISGDLVIGAAVVTKRIPNYFHAEQMRSAEAIMSQATVVIQNAWLFDQVRAGHDRLQSLYHRLIEVQENERRYIARELHDETSQALSSTMISLRLLEQEQGLPQGVREKVINLKKIIDEVLENLHRLAMNLHPASLDLLGLVSALEQLVIDFRELYGMNIQFKAAGNAIADRLPGDLEINVYRIVQEALNNVVRHASAENVDVIIDMQDNKVMAIVEDDGVGYTAKLETSTRRLGLVGMHERAQMAGGLLQIESKPGGGTTVVVEIPYAN